jgi:Tfp pilus assembly protein PilF
MKPKFVCLLLCLFATTGYAFGGEKPWIEVRSPHFRVLTNAGGGEAREVAREFEEFRALMAIRYPTFRLESGAPLLIFAARDEETAKALNPNLWKTKGEKYASYYSHSWEKQYAMLRLDTWVRESQVNVFYDYAQMLLSLNTRWVPTWLSVGFDEFYSFTRYQENQALIGAPSERLLLLKLLARPTIPVEVMLDVNTRSPYMHDETEVYRFRAEAWALFHYLTLGPDMEDGKKLDQFFGKLQDGADQKTAFQQVFGSFKSVDAALQKYVERFTMRSLIVKNPPRFNEKDFSTRTMTMAETQAELGGYHLWSRDWDNARDYVRDALNNDPNLGLAHEEQGFLYLYDGKDAEALKEFTEALAKDKSLYLSQFFKTMMSSQATSDARADQSIFRQGLTDTLNLNLQFAPAFIQLSWLAVRQNDLKTALNYATRAEALEPSRAGYHTYTGQILFRMGRYQEAAEHARYVAQRWLTTDHNEAVDLWNSIPATQRPAGETLVEDRPKDTERAEGVMKEATCGDRKQWSLTIAQGDRSVSFRQAEKFRWGFSDTFWYGQNHIRICHGLEGKRTIAYYKPSSSKDSAGDAVEVEVRNELPAPPAKSPAD